MNMQMCLSGQKNHTHYCLLRRSRQKGGDVFPPHRQPEAKTAGQSCLGFDCEPNSTELFQMLNEHIALGLLMGIRGHVAGLMFGIT